MALQDLNNATMHSRDLHAERFRHSDVFSPGNHKRSGEEPSPFVETETWKDFVEPPQGGDLIIPPQSPGMTFDGKPEHHWRKKIALVLGGISCLLLIGGVIMKVRTTPFDEQAIVLTLLGPNKVASAETVTFNFGYTNNNEIALTKSVVIFEYPETFHPDEEAGLSIKKSRAEMTIGTITAHHSGKVALSGKFYGSKGDQSPISAELQYMPSNTTSAFTIRTQQSVAISSSSIFFEITAPNELASGQEVQYDIRYGNVGDMPFSNLKVKLEYPEGFTFTDASIKPFEGETLWQVGNLAPHEEGSFAVRGRLSGSRNDQRTVHGSIGFFQGDGKFAMYGDHEWKTRIVASPLSVRQTVEGKTDASINPGDSLSYTVSYTNEGNVGVRDAIIMVEVDSPYIDFSTLTFNARSGNGAYNQSLKAIVWKASDVPELKYIEAGQSGKVQFSFATYVDIEKRGAGQKKNNTIRTLARVDSPDIRAIVGQTKVVASNEIFVKFNTAVTSAWKGYYQDVTLPNTGPLPPVVGEETSYTLHFSVKNTLNDIEEGRVSVLLPTGIRYTGKKYPESEGMAFNERRNELVWDMGNFAAGQTREILFQVAVTPDPSSVNQEVVLASQATFTGKDSFTGKEFEVKSEKKTNNLEEDPLASTKEYRVQAVKTALPL